MVRHFLAFVAASVFAAFAAPAWAGCTTNTPLSVWGQNGSNGLVASTGTPNTYDAGSVVGQVTNDLTDLNGTANLHGSADCSDDFARLNRELEDTQSNLAALTAASSHPVWLEAGESFAFSGGLGFADGATALGGTGIMRLDKHWSAFAGGAISMDDSDLWSGKIGARFGF